MPPPFFGGPRGPGGLLGALVTGAVVGGVVAGISDQALELSPGQNFLIFFQIQPIEQNPII